MSIVQTEYLRRMNLLTPTARIERAATLFQWTREMIARQIVAERGPMSAEELKWRVAQRQYGSEFHVNELITRMLADVSH